VSVPPAAPSPFSAPPVSAPPVSGPPTTHASGQYEDWARRQRPQGTVYGSGAAANQPASSSPVEHSGSLTGQILRQGTDEPPPKSNTTRVVVIMTVVLSLLVIVGLVVAVFARNALLDILKGG
jgi:hypothetical protein